jgi:DNA repair protein RadD
MEHVRTSTEPCLIDAATGAGKSLIIADVANRLHNISGGKHVLCLAPSAELVTQNREKYLLTGEPASLFSASGGGRSLRHPVVFGTPGTVKNAIARFGDRFCAVVVDECHGITPTVRAIIDAMRGHNPNLRVIGLTATPYRLGEGYIYRIGLDGKPCHDGTIRDPYFLKCVDRITPHELIAKGYLTPPTIGAPLTDGYDTSGLKLNARHQFDSGAVDAAFVGHGRKTAGIVADVVEQARDRMGVMLFAATVQHAEEVMASLPPHLSAIVTGKTPKEERKSIITQFKARQLKYLVNVSVLTTGFDAPHVDLVALLRRTESVGLMQQIIGRGLRLHDDKHDCLVLDYAGNIENHCPDGDLFNPEIRAIPEKEGGGTVNCKCPLCEVENVFSGRQNSDGFAHDENGYFVDLAGNKIETDHGPMPAHYGRRCMGGDMVAGKWVQCGYRWTSKDCPHCEEPNDIAARYCHHCKGELIDPNEKLAMEFRALKKSPYNRQCDEVLKCDVRDSISGSGNPTKRIDIVTPYRSFSVWLQMNPKHPRALQELELWRALGGELPRSVEYKKEESGFFRVFSWNKEPDIDPT